MSSYRQLTALPAALAQIVRGALEAEGIDVVLDPALVTVYGLDSGEWATRVLVDPDQFDRARELLDEFSATDH